MTVTVYTSSSSATAIYDANKCSSCWHRQLYATLTTRLSLTHLTLFFPPHLTPFPPLPPPLLPQGARTIAITYSNSLFTSTTCLAAKDYALLQASTPYTLGIYCTVQHSIVQHIAQYKSHTETDVCCVTYAYVTLCLHCITHVYVSAYGRTHTSQHRDLSYNRISHSRTYAHSQ